MAHIVNPNAWQHGDPEVVNQAVNYIYFPEQTSRGLNHQASVTEKFCLLVRGEKFTNAWKAYYSRRASVESMRVELGKDRALDNINEVGMYSSLQWSRWVVL